MSRSIVRRFSAIFGSKVGVLALTLITTPILVRLLGSGGYGDYSFLLSTLQWALVFVYAGAFKGTRKYIAEDRSDDWADHVFAFYFRLVVVLAAVVVSAVFFLSRSQYVASFLGPEFSRYFVVLALIIPVRAVFRIGRSTLMGFGLESYSEPLQIVDRVLFAAMIVTVSVVGGGVAAALTSRVVSTGIAALLALALVSRRIDLSKLASRSTGPVPAKRLAIYSGSTMALSFLLLSLYHVDVILLRLFVGSSATGYYRAALVIAEFLWFVPTAIQVTLLHSTSQLWIDERYDRLTEISTRAVRYTFLCTALLALGVSGLAEPVLTLYFGPAFDAAVIPLLLLLPGAIGFAVARPVFAISQGQENLRHLIGVTGVAALLNAVLNVVLIPQFGPSGAAIATSLGYGSMFGLHVWNARRLGFDPLSDVRAVPVMGTVLVAAVPILGLPHLLESDLLSLVVVPPVGAAAFAALALATGAVRSGEIRRVASASPVPTTRLAVLCPDRVIDAISPANRER
ncbi:polysaccharide biosynthesis C-terminal domain-containing protein [Natrinema sp. SYSU A 869]|uniref:oligosaccharide flippase family protein n=1 Tax=Natrinema sp. SYSU A 869 TaxID=2871694 RepID=UPI001CA3F63B|nr:polysaccharide biosynthesis C-terminal domain-containing protein [Natrinema sp. SYSU A 869]